MSQGASESQNCDQAKQLRWKPSSARTRDGSSNVADRVPSMIQVWRNPWNHRCYDLDHLVIIIITSIDQTQFQEISFKKLLLQPATASSRNPTGNRAVDVAAWCHSAVSLRALYFLDFASSLQNGLLQNATACVESSTIVHTCLSNAVFSGIALRPVRCKSGFILAEPQEGWLTLASTSPSARQARAGTCLVYKCFVRL